MTPDDRCCVSFHLSLGKGDPLSASQCGHNPQRRSSDFTVRAARCGETHPHRAHQILAAALRLTAPASHFCLGHARLRFSAVAGSS